MNLRTLDLNLLRVLDALLAEGSTVGAGERLGLSQPAVSAALKRLRDALGDPLFLRRGQGLEPTDYARSLAIPLAAALAGLETLLTRPGSFDPGRATDTIRLSASDYFSEILMPPLAERVSRLAPGLQIVQLGLNTGSYIDALGRDEMDMLLVPGFPVPDWAEAAPLITSTFTVIARHDHPRLARAGVAPGAVIPLDLFCDLSHIVFSTEGNPVSLGDAALARLGRKRRVVMTMPFFVGIYRTVAASDRIALIPTALARRIGKSNGLSLYGMPMDTPLAQLSMIWRRRSSANPAHLWLRTQIRQILAPFDESRTRPVTTA